MFSPTARLTAAAVVLSLTQSAYCISWSAAAGGSFQDGANWAGVVPGPTDVALFDLGSQTYTVSFAANTTNSNLILGRDNITFDLSGFTYNLTRATPESIFIGELAFDSAVLTLTNGTLSGVDATIAQTAGGTGVLNIPTGGTLAISGNLWIGESGNGGMNVTGGAVNTTGGTTWIAKEAGGIGNVLLSGATSVWTNTNSLAMGAGTSTLTVQNGATLNTNRLSLGNTFSSNAGVILDGPTSSINITSELTMSGLGGTTTMTVRNGADLTSGNALIGNVGIGADARFLITDPGSTWVSTGKISASLRGDAPGGVLRIENGAVVTSVTGAVSDLSDSQGAAFIDGTGSAWNMSGDLQVGLGAATLSITNGGTVSNANGVIDNANTTRPINILVDGPGSTWANSGAVTGGSGATMTIQNGGVVTSDSANVAVQFTLDGAGSRWDITNGLTLGGFPAPSATISNGATLTSNGGTLNRADLLVSGGTWTNTGTLVLNDSSQSDLRITNGGTVTNLATTLVQTAGRVANVTVQGAGSLWWITGDLRIGDAGDDGFGSGGVATLNIRDGGRVISNNVVAATAATGRATILLENNNTRWDVSGNLVLGGPDFATLGGTADMTIASGATAQVGATLKVHAGSTVQLLGGTLSVFGNSNFIVDDAAGLDFQFGTLQYRNDATFSLSDMQMILGLVPTLGPAKTIEVGGVATLNTSLIIDGGTFSVGQLQGSTDPLFLNGTLTMTNDSLTIGAGGRFGASLTLQSNRVLNVGNFVVVDPGSVLTVDQTTMTAGSLTNNGEVMLNGASAFLGGGSMDNMGRLSGNGRLGLGLTNASTGVVSITSGNRLIADGGQNFNSGRIDLAGGTIEFTQFTQNNTGGLIAGNGTIISRSAFTNDGNMAFSGATNFIGDITNSATGLVLVTGVGPTTFFDDVTHNGEVRTSAGATAVFLGAVSGTGIYTGTGTNRFEGDFTPGASPGNIPFGGDVSFTASASLGIELAGGGGIPGVDFDALNVAGDVALNGTLNVSTFGGYTPQPGMTFDIITFGGSLTGAFNNVVNNTGLAGLILNVTSNANSVVLTLDSLAGDLNLDGFVGIADLNIVLGNWNQSVPPGDPLADPSGDGFVGIADLNTVLGNWNAGTPPGAAGNAAVPEPATSVLLGAGGLVILRRRSACSRRLAAAG